MSKLSDAVPNRVRALRMERGWSLAELARRADTTAPTIMRLERSTRQLSFDWLDRLAAAFGVEPFVLAFGPGVQTKTHNRQIPIVGKIAAGNWKEAIHAPEGTIEVPASMAPGENIFALRPDGDSMNMVVPEGGLVLIDPDDAELHEGRIYAVMNADGDTTIKRYRHNPARLEPCSTNHDHQPILLGRQPFTVVGRAIGSYSSL